MVLSVVSGGGDVAPPITSFDDATVVVTDDAERVSDANRFEPF